MWYKTTQTSNHTVRSEAVTTATTVNCTLNNPSACPHTPAAALLLHNTILLLLKFRLLTPRISSTNVGTLGGAGLLGKLLARLS